MFLRSQPTYEELKQYLDAKLGDWRTGSQPTYEELKLDPLLYRRQRLPVPSLPMRN